MNKNKKFQNIPIKWYIIFPLLGLIHRALSAFGWLWEGSWFNFFLLLGIIALWPVVVLNETEYPFRPLVWLGGINGLVIAIFESLFWYFTRPPLGLEEQNWSFYDLMHAISYYANPLLLVFGLVLYGFLFGALLGFICNRIVKYRKKAIKFNERPSFLIEMIQLCYDEFTKFQSRVGATA